MINKVLAVGNLSYIPADLVNGILHTTCNHKTMKFIMPMQFWHSEPQYKIKILHYLITNLTKITRSRSIFNHVTHADLCQVLDHLFHCGLQVRLFLTGQQTQLRFAARLTVKQENKGMLDTDHTRFLMMFDRLMLHSHNQQNMFRVNIDIQNMFLFPFTRVVH